MPKCTLLVGVPGSGKSTWLNQNISDRDRIVSTDNIIDALGKVYDFTYDEIFRETIRFADMVMVKWMLESAEAGDNLYIDRTNLTAKSRAQFINKLKKYGYEFECVVFPEVGSEALSKEEWKRRLNSRPGKTIPQEALDRMVYSYEIPLMSEGFKKITFL